MYYENDSEYEPLPDIEFKYAYKVDRVTVKSTEELPYDEVKAYVERAQNRQILQTIYAIPDGDYIKLWYRYARRKFDRIRRITGYLVGTLDRFNDAKRAEESERVKHGVNMGRSGY